MLVAGERESRNGVDPVARTQIDHDDGQHLCLQCPRCRNPIFDFNCIQCGFCIRQESGILHALPPERSVHFARFVEDYERIRDAEGRGSSDDSFYLALPYRDLSGKNQAQWHIRAHSFECLVEHVLRPQLSTHARILDLGAGNCWLSFRLSLEGYRPTAVDLLTNDRDGLGAAAHYRNFLPDFFPRFRAELTRLPFANEQFDAVVFNASFHYAEDEVAALREAFRCVRKGGIVAICDTPWYSCEESGRRMVSERRHNFIEKYGTASDSIESIEFLTNESLELLQERLDIQWSIYFPSYGLRWALRPVLAKLKGKREPARFCLYIARKTDR